MKPKPKERDRFEAIASNRTARVLLILAGLASGLLAYAQGGRAEPPASNAFAWTIYVAGSVLAIIFNGLFVASCAAIEQLRPGHIKPGDRDEALGIPELYARRARAMALCSLGSLLMRAAIVMLAFLPALELASPVAGEEGHAKTLIYGLLLALPGLLINYVFCELTARTIGNARPQRVAKRLRGFVSALAPLLSPISRLLLRVSSLITRRYEDKDEPSTSSAAEDEIRNLAESAEESGEIEVVEKQLLHSVFEFTDTVAREIMTPRVDMDAVPLESSLDELMEVIERSGHSRIPVYEGNDDQIIGIVHAKDLLLARIRGQQPPLKDLLRPAIFVPESKSLHELLHELRSGRTQMAVVQDEFGGTSGIVTIEDIVEELVGEIVDEYDEEEPEIVANGDGFLVDGKTNLYDLNEEIGSALQSEEFDTIGGYVFGLFGRQPKVGEEIEADGYQFKIENTDGRRILQVQVRSVDAGSELESSLSI